MKQILGVIAGAAVLVVVFQFMGPLGVRNEEKPPADDGGEIEILDTSQGPRVLLDDEDAAEAEPPVSIDMDVAGASGGRAFYLGPEKVNEQPETRQYRKGYPGAPHPGYARWRFETPQTANYRVWVRVRWSDDCGDSLDVAVNGRFLGTVQGNADKDNPRWMWLPVGTVDQPLTVHLPAETAHTLTLANREDDLHFDQVLLVEAGNAIQPVGVQTDGDDATED